MADPFFQRLADEWPVSRALAEFTDSRESDRDPGMWTCPFCYHLQETPAATLHTDEVVWHCFRCKAGGNVFGLVRRVFQVNFREVVTKLAGADVLGDLRLKAKIRRQETPLRVLANFTYKDQLRERKDFLILNEMILRNVKQEIALIHARVRLGELTEEEARGEEIAIKGIADEYFEKLDRNYVEMLYYLRLRNKKPSKPKTGRTRMLPV